MFTIQKGFFKPLDTLLLFFKKDFFKSKIASYSQKYCKLFSTSKFSAHKPSFGECWTNQIG